MLKIIPSDYGHELWLVNPQKDFGQGVFSREEHILITESVDLNWLSAIVVELGLRMPDTTTFNDFNARENLYATTMYAIRYEVPIQDLPRLYEDFGQ